MSVNSGFINEHEFFDYINNKKYDELNSNIQALIKYLYKGIPDGLIKCEKGHSGQKPDVIIIINEKRFPISLKIGGGNSVHQESFQDFIEFLINIGLKTDEIKLLKLFHYADGTEDDTGSIRYSSDEYCKLYPQNILKLNKILNKPEIKEQIMERVLFQGKSKSYERAEYLYHGSLNHGLWASSNEIKESTVMLKKDCVHVGNLTYQVWGRNQNRKAVHPDRRYVTQFKFGNCEKVLLSIRRGK